MQTLENINPADNLISGYLNGELTTDETKELLSWLKMDSANKRYYDEYCDLWITCKSSLKNTGYSYHQGFWKFKQRIKVDEAIRIDLNKTTWVKAFIKYAAIFIIAFSISGFLFYKIGRNQFVVPRQSFSELIVPMGSRAQFTLPDGTTVSLNAGSRLKYDSMFGINDRVVELEGEGYFKVAKDSKRLFTVKTSFLNVNALGTAFNVKAYSDDNTIETTLVEGSIKIEEVTVNGKPEVMVLKPNQKLTFFKADLTMVGESAVAKEKIGNESQKFKAQRSIPIPKLVMENVNVDPVISWKDSRWIFENQSLSDIATDLERRFDVKIHFESEQLKNFRFTGIIIAEPIEQVLQVMSISAPISFKLKGKVVTLSENKNIGEINKRLYKRQ